MPSLDRAPNEKELEYLIRLFLWAETSIINEIGRLRSLGLVDYHAVAALERVQKILRKLENDCWEYVPRMIEKLWRRRPGAGVDDISTFKRLSYYFKSSALKKSRVFYII